MKKIIFISVVFFTFFSCGNKTEEIPEDILTEERMVQVLIDMYILEGGIAHGNLIDGKAFEKGVKEYERIFEKHKTNKTQVEKSIDYYIHHPEMMKKIQIQVLDSLNVKGI